MTSSSAPHLDAIDVVWLTAGLGCDGATVAITGATQPSLEDLLQGTIPGLPRVRLHNPVLAFENGDEYLAVLRRAVAGQLDPFLLVVEGSIPNEKFNNKAEGYWAGFGTDEATGQPIPTCTWIDRLAPRAWAVVAAGTCSAYGGIHAMADNPTGCMGLADYLGKGWKARGGTGDRIVNVPGCPVQPDNMRRYCCSPASKRSPPASSFSASSALS
jgi:hydrogenase small subunit